MKQSFQKFRLAGVALLLVVLAGCGGGGGGTVSSNASNVIAGKVIDGYIIGATVCLDINANLACDANEPTAQSLEGGTYTLPAYSGSIDGMHVIAVVPAGAVDSDLGTITKPFDLLAPAESANAVTPLTTLVATEMSSRQITAAEAEKAIKAQFNLQADKLLGNDVTKDPETLKVAQVVTAAIASTKENLKSLNTTSNLGLDNANLIKAAIAEVKINVLPKVLTSDGKAAVDVAGKTQAQLVSQIANQADVGTVLQGRVQQIVAQSKAGDAKVLNMADAFKEGIVIASFDSGDYYDANNKRVGNWNGYSDKLKVESIQFNSTDSAPLRSTKVYLYDKTNDLNWYTDYQSDDVKQVYDGKSWIKSNGDDLAQKPIIQDNCIFLPVATGSSVGTKVCAVAKDLSGKALSDFLKDEKGNSKVCKLNGDITKSDMANCDPNQKLPAGSYAYDLTFSTNQDLYEIWVSNDSWTGYQYTGFDSSNPSATTPTIAKFIESLQASPQWKGSNCSVGFMVKSFAGTTGVMNWGENTSGKGCNGASVSTYAETTTFKIENVGGKEVLRVYLPNLFRKLNPGDGGTEAIFAVVDKEINGKTIPGIFSGDYSPASASMTVPFTGNPNASSQVVNRTLFDSFMKALGVKAYPYPSR